MDLCLAFVGMPNSGKTTIFQTLTAKTNSSASSYPFSTTAPEKKTIKIQDNHIENYCHLLGLNNYSLPTLSLMDLPSLTFGSSKGEGLGNQFLGYLKQTDLLINVIAAFEKPSIEQMTQEINCIQHELIEYDLEEVKRLLSSIPEQLKSPDEEIARNARISLPLAEKILLHLQNGKPVNKVKFTNPEDVEVVKNFKLTSSLPVINLINSLDDVDETIYKDIMHKFTDENNHIICAKMSAELYKTGKTSLLWEQIVSATKTLLNIGVFYSIDEEKMHGWLFPKGSMAPLVAATIHPDLKNNFNSLKVINLSSRKKENSHVVFENEAFLKDRNYIVQENDIVLFHNDIV